MNTTDSYGVGAKRPHAEKAYRIALCALEPLTFKAIVQAISVKDDLSLHQDLTDDYVRNITSNILEESQPKSLEESPPKFQGYDRQVAFTHPCAREFLEDPKGIFENKFSVTENHTALAELCLATLMVPDFYRSERSNSSRKDDFYEYAVDNWHAHCNFGGTGKESRDVQKSLLWRFLDPIDNLAFEAWGYRTQRRAEPSDTWSYQSWSSFNQAFAAASFGLQGVLQNLASRSLLNINERDHKNRNLLHVASSCDQYWVAEFLIGLGIPKDDRAYNERTALHLACEMNNIQIADLLLSAPNPADATKADKSRRTCFHYACQHREDTRLLELLINRSDVVSMIAAAQETNSARDESVIQYAMYLRSDKALRLVLRQVIKSYESARNACQNAKQPDFGTEVLLKPTKALVQAKKCLQHIDRCLRSTLSPDGFPLTRMFFESGLSATFTEDGNLLHSLARMPLKDWQLDNVARYLKENGADSRLVDAQGMLPFERASLNAAFSVEHLALFDPGTTLMSRRNLLDRMLVRTHDVLKFPLRTHGLRFILDADPSIIQGAENIADLEEELLTMVRRNLSPILVLEQACWTNTGWRFLDRDGFDRLTGILDFFGEALAENGSGQLQMMADLLQRIREDEHLWWTEIANYWSSTNQDIIWDPDEAFERCRTKF